MKVDNTFKNKLSFVKVWQRIVYWCNIAIVLAFCVILAYCLLNGCSSFCSAMQKIANIPTPDIVYSQSGQGLNHTYPQETIPVQNTDTKYSPVFALAKSVPQTIEQTRIQFPTPNNKYAAQAVFQADDTTAMYTKVTEDLRKATDGYMDATVSNFIFLGISTFLISMFLVLYLNALHKIHEFKEEMRNAEEKLCATKKDVEATKKDVEATEEKIKKFFQKFVALKEIHEKQICKSAIGTDLLQLPWMQPRQATEFIQQLPSFSDDPEELQCLLRCLRENGERLKERIQEENQDTGSSKVTEQEFENMLSSTLKKLEETLAMKIAYERNIMAEKAKRAERR